MVFSLDWIGWFFRWIGLVWFFCWIGLVGFFVGLDWFSFFVGLDWLGDFLGKNLLWFQGNGFKYWFWINRRLVMVFLSAKILNIILSNLINGC